jgi:hypothetical protein
MVTWGAANCCAGLEWSHADLLPCARFAQIRFLIYLCNTVPFLAGPVFVTDSSVGCRVSNHVVLYLRVARVGVQRLSLLLEHHQTGNLTQR